MLMHFKVFVKAASFQLIEFYGWGPGGPGGQCITAPGQDTRGRCLAAGDEWAGGAGSAGHRSGAPLMERREAAAADGWLVRRPDGQRRGY
ncbi:hypothetical protein AAFF_G00252410 [Aldrovandia affinis]|uniref:Uncharacterized protein n=1 Tax=Aldrovandia affinis TaxID=143900 RepID=A0AAD7SVJ6_9TELE|nr:hypothetical protein AAFF_G00252410 [Aldrovandia affinis]